MVTKELIKTELDKVQDEYLEALYKIVVAFRAESAGRASRVLWEDFVQETYGCLADDPIRRKDQGTYEVREVIE